MFLRYIFWHIALISLLATMFGCGDNSLAEVKGYVTLDGKPVNGGGIRFTPLDGKSQITGALIENGKFQTRTPVAKHRVEIEATARTGPEIKQKMKFSDEPDNIVQLIPAKYNSQSTLTLDVKPGLNEPRFELTTGNK